ncbi:hypothetical protein [Spirosoma sp.]|uniref:hypothetical protein n=1 Tax=Spirosoma sp. TaxID=1899569 RepID=UPI003B3A18E3
MKIKILQACQTAGHEFETGQEAEVSLTMGKNLIKLGFAVEVEVPADAAPAKTAPAKPETAPAK